jgi:putative transposase
VIAVWQLARSSFYAARQRHLRPRAAAKRGPKRLSDQDLASEIRQLLDQSVFHGEGYRKVWARLRHKGVRVWKERVLRVMRGTRTALAEPAAGARPANPHEGRTIADEPNDLWGTDGTTTFTEEDGQVTIFAAVNHCSAYCVGIHAVKRAHRFEALEPIRQGIREHFGTFSAGERPRKACSNN